VTDPAPHPKVNLTISSDLNVDPPSENSLSESISKSLGTILAGLNLPVDPVKIEISVTITNDPSIRILNLKHRDLDSPTDVLSFPLLTDSNFVTDNGENGPPLALGDIVLSIDTILRQASERDQMPSERFTECLIHGILHLLGYEHDNDSDQAHMEAVEDDIIPLVHHLFTDLPWGGKKAENR